MISRFRVRVGRARRFKLAKAAVTGVATGAALAGGAPAEAVPVYNDPPDALLNKAGDSLSVNLAPPGFEGSGNVLFNLRNDATNENLNLFVNPLEVSQNAAAVINSPLNFGDDVGPRNASNFSDKQEILAGWNFATNEIFGPFAGLNNGFLGTRHVFEGGAAPQDFYGWIRFSIDDQFNVTFFDLAVEDTAGQAILVGAGAPVPEPGALALMALGAVGLAAWRRRRSAA
jgi:hypothetical protein